MLGADDGAGVTDVGDVEVFAEDEDGYASGSGQLVVEGCAVALCVGRGGGGLESGGGCLKELESSFS